MRMRMGEARALAPRQAVEHDPALGDARFLKLPAPRLLPELRALRFLLPQLLFVLFDRCRCDILADELAPRIPASTGP